MEGRSFEMQKLPRSPHPLFTGAPVAKIQSKREKISIGKIASHRIMKHQEDKNRT